MSEKEQFIPADNCPSYGDCLILNHCFNAYIITTEADKAQREPTYNLDRRFHPIRKCSHPQLTQAVEQFEQRFSRKVLFRAKNTSNST